MSNFKGKMLLNMHGVLAIRVARRGQGGKVGVSGSAHLHAECVPNLANDLYCHVHVSLINCTL